MLEIAFDEFGRLYTKKYKAPKIGSLIECQFFDKPILIVTQIQIQKACGKNIIICHGLDIKTNNLAITSNFKKLA